MDFLMNWLGMVRFWCHVISFHLSQRQSDCAWNLFWYIFFKKKMELLRKSIGLETLHTLSKRWPPSSKWLLGFHFRQSVNSPLHFFQVKKIKENLEQISTGLEMFEIFPFERLRLLLLAGLLSSSLLPYPRTREELESKLLLIDQETLNFPAYFYFRI